MHRVARAERVHAHSDVQAMAGSATARKHLKAFLIIPFSSDKIVRWAAHSPSAPALLPREEAAPRAQPGAAAAHGQPAVGAQRAQPEAAAARGQPALEAPRAQPEAAAARGQPALEAPCAQ